MAGKSARPVLITIIGAIYALFGILYLLGGIVILAGVEIEGFDVADPTYMGIVSIASTVVYLVIATGLLKGWKIMWYLGVIVEVICAIGYLISAVSGESMMIIGTIIALLILIYLTRPGVKSFFLD